MCEYTDHVRLVENETVREGIGLPPAYAVAKKFKLIPHYSYGCLSCSLIQTQATKFLGVIIDHHLSWKYHVALISKTDFLEHWNYC